jgi:Xaa-Pro aminopeptidase
MNLDSIQAALREQKLDGWLFYDHHHRDPIAYRVLGLDEHLHVTRRWYYLIPAVGEPRKLVHRIEQGRLDSLPGRKALYSSWQELDRALAYLVGGCRKIAMQYSPRNANMYVSTVDAGTVEAIRELGKKVVSSADLVSRFEAVLTDGQIASHYDAQKAIDEILAEGFEEIGRRVRADASDLHPPTEYSVMLWLREQMATAGIVSENGPDVAVNENSSDSHYEPTADKSKTIREGDFVLIDIWGRTNIGGSCYYDICWTGVVGREPSAREQLVFDTVRDARDAAVAVVEQAFREGRPLPGWQVDDVARSVVNKAGFGQYFTHRTGHNIGTQIHGNGAHLDNLETHDDRLILPRTCFSVEPGIYLPEFGVRSEVNIITREGEAHITGRNQRELVRI